MDKITGNVLFPMRQNFSTLTSTCKKLRGNPTVTREDDPSKALDERIKEMQTCKTTSKKKIAVNII